MKYKENVIYEGNLDGWVCEGVPKIFNLKKIVKNGYMEVEIDMPTTPLTKKKTPNQKLHVISGWETAVFSQDSINYKSKKDADGNIIQKGKGKSNFVSRVGKYDPAKTKLQNDNKLSEDKVKKPDNFGGKHIYRVEYLEGIVTYLFNGEIMKIEHGKKAEYNVGKSFGLQYFLFGRDNKYKVLIDGISFYNYKIGEFVEDTGEVDPVDPVNPEDTEEIIVPEKPESIKTMWDNLPVKTKWLVLAIAIIFILVIGFIG